MPEYTLGHGSYKVHFGIADKPSSVKCGNWMPYTENLSWSDELALVTCRTCLNRLEKHNAAIHHEGSKDG